jgi:hypothetical protein
MTDIQLQASLKSAKLTGVRTATVQIEDEG